MQKQDYINVVNKKFKGEAKKVMLEQIEEYYRLSQLSFKLPKYKVGDLVKLPKNTYLNGFGSDLKMIDIYAEKGLVNKDFEFGVTGHLISYCFSLWHIKKPIKLADYIKNYSGMTACVEGKEIIVPYGKLDEFVEKMRNYPHFMWEAESTQEIRFMPSLARDKNQLAFIINGQSKELKKLMFNNLANPEFDVKLALEFAHFKIDKKKEDWLKARASGKFGTFWDRVAYVLFGLPNNLVEGILVGRKYEKDKKVLKHIKEKYPNCYICNLDGKVIVE